MGNEDVGTQRKQRVIAIQKRILSSGEAEEYMGMGHTMFYGMGIPSLVPSVGLLERKKSFDIRDLDALIDHVKATGSYKGFKLKKPQKASGQVISEVPQSFILELGAVFPVGAVFKIERLPDGVALTPQSHADQKPGA